MCCSKTALRIATILLLCCSLNAQVSLPLMGVGGTAAGGGGLGIFTLVHNYAQDCGGGVKVCTATITALGSGHGVGAFCFLVYPTSTTNALPTSVTSTANAFTPPATANVAVLATHNYITLGGAYNISSISGTTSVTCNWANATAGSVEDAIIHIFEYSYTGSSISFDNANAVSNAACTNCSGVSLTLSGSVEVVMQALMADTTTNGCDGGTITGGAGYTSPNEQSVDGEVSAGAINTSNGAAPTWNGCATSDKTVGYAMAFKGN